VASISDQTKARVRRALGYIGIPETSRLYYGLTVDGEFLSLLNARLADANLDDYQVAMIAEELGRVEATDEQLFKAQIHLGASKVGGIETNPEEIERLLGARNRWAWRLSRLLDVPFDPNPAAGGGGLNVRVAHG